VAGTLSLLLSFAVDAAADPSNESYSEYERETIAMALERHDAEIDPNPAGKRVVAIDIEVLDVIEARDPVPNFLNVFHVNTKDYILRRAMLFGVGDPYDPRRANESERNMRGLRQQSLVIVLPLKTEHPDEVRVLIVAKDIWSLRLNSTISSRQPIPNQPQLRVTTKVKSFLAIHQTTHHSGSHLPVVARANTFRHFYNINTVNPVHALSWASTAQAEAHVGTGVSDMWHCTRPKIL